MATIANASNWLESNGIVAFKVLKNKNIVFKYPVGDESEKASTQEAIQFFEQNIRATEAGYYTMHGRRTVGTFGSGDLVFTFSHQHNATQGNAIGGLSEDRIGQLIAAQTGTLNAQWEARLKDLQHQYEVTELKKQIKEAKEGSGAVTMHDASNLLSQMITLLDGIKANPPAAIAGVPQAPRAPMHVATATPTVATPTDDRGRFGNAIAKITSVTGDETITAFEALARLAETAPGQFSLYMKHLISQSQPNPSQDADASS